MFSIIFFLSIFIFLFNGFNQLGLFQYDLFLSNLYQWLTLPVMTAILIAVVESFYSSNNFDKGFFLFTIFSLFTFGLVFFPLPVEEFLSYVRITIAVGVTFFSIYQLVKWKNMQTIFFLASVFSFSIAGISHSQQQNALSIYSYFIAYLFLSLVFIWYNSDEDVTKKGIGSYFSLQKKLTYTQSVLEENRELYKNIVENTQDVILLTRPNGMNSYVSPSSEKVLGYTPKELTTSNPWPITVHPDDASFVQQAMNKGYAGYPGSDLEYRIFTKKNELRWISHSWSPIFKDGELQTIVSSIKDITDLKETQQKLAERINHLKRNELATLNIMEDFQDSIESLKRARKQIDRKNDQLKQSQKELKKLNEELEQRVQDRTKEVERLLKQKDAFIDQLGHDLKHPLGPFINLIPILKNNETDEKKREILNVLERNVDYMKRLVIRTVRLAKLNAPSTTFDLEPIHFEQLIEKIIEKNKSMFNQNDVTINTDINHDLMINADYLQIEEVIENLFSNAIKYGAKNGSIMLRAKKSSEEGFVLISVEDTGNGMTPDQIDSVFNEFYKADNSRHDFSSTGLGLSICKRIVEKHGGKIWIESKGIGKGTTIYFTLPIHNKKVESVVSA